MFVTLENGSMLNVLHIKRISPPGESHDVLVETSDGKMVRVTQKDFEEIKSVVAKLNPTNWNCRASSCELSPSD